jgi:aspartyl-tRNA synthetase
MVAGFDKYFQIARCFRDEDQRGDRQPEFTQFEIEMSFCEQEDILTVMERCFIEVTERLQPDRRITPKPFHRLTWREALEKYGSDKPDLRCDLPLTNVTDLVKGTSFKTFSEEVKKGGVVSALRVPKGAEFTHGEIDELTLLAKNHGAKGLAYLAVKPDRLQSPILTYLGEETAQNIVERTGAKPQDLIFFGAGEFEAALTPLGKVRQAIGGKLGLIDSSQWNFVWIVEFPLFERNRETGKLDARHHPFTRPHSDDVHLLDSDPLAVRAIAHDLVLNGVEIGGGSVRIHEADLQAKVFDLLGISKADAQRRFGHMLKAFQYGAPPHGGIAMGLDRYIMLLSGEPNIREVIAFPKDQAARDLMMGAPAPMPEEQLRELGIKIIEE